MISTSQLFCILLLSRLASEIVHPAVGGYDITTFAAAATAEAIGFVLALPLLIYAVRGKDFYRAIAAKSRVLGWIIGIAAAFLLALAAARSALFTAEFVQRNILAGMSAAVIAVFIGGFAVYAAAKGAEAIARTGVLVLGGASLLTLVILLADIPRMRGLQLSSSPISSDFLNQVVERLMRCGEYLVFAALLPYLNRSKGLSPSVTLLTYAGASTAAVLLLNLFCMAVLGEFFGMAEFPFTSAAQLSDIALFKRLDGFAGAVWTAAAAVRCGLLLFASYAIIHRLSTFGKGALNEKTSHSGGSGSRDAA